MGKISRMDMLGPLEPFYLWQAKTARCPNKECLVGRKARMNNCRISQIAKNLHQSDPLRLFADYINGVDQRTRGNIRKKHCLNVYGENGFPDIVYAEKSNDPSTGELFIDSKSAKSHGYDVKKLFREN